MLVAKKNYSYFEEDYGYNLKTEKKRAVKTKNSKKQKTSPLRALLCIAILFSVGFLIMVRHASITELSNAIDKQEEYISSLEKNNSQIKADLAVNLIKVDDIAKNKLQMERPYSYQIVYLNVSDDENEGTINNKEQENQKFIAKLSKIVEYLY